MLVMAIVLIVRPAYRAKNYRLAAVKSIIAVIAVLFVVAQMMGIIK